MWCVACCLGEGTLKVACLLAGQLLAVLARDDPPPRRSILLLLLADSAAVDLMCGAFLFAFRILPFGFNCSVIEMDKKNTLLNLLNVQIQKRS